MTESFSLQDEDTLVEGLSKRGMPVWGALVVAPQIAALGSPLRDAFFSWWQTGDVPDVSIRGKSVQSLIDAGLSPLAALLSLDALERSPATTSRGLQWGQEQFVPIAFHSSSPRASGDKE